MRRPTSSDIFFFLVAIGIVAGIGGAYLFEFVASSNKPPNTFDPIASNKNPITHDEEVEQQTNNAVFSDISDHIQALKQFEDLFVTENFDEAEANIYLYVAQIPSSNLGDIFEATTNPSFDATIRVRHKLQIALLERLAVSDPEEAVEHAVANDLQRQLVALSSHASGRLARRFALPPSAPAQSSFITTVFFSWSRSDLSDAITHAHSLDEQSRKLALTGILESQLGKPLDELREIAVELGNEQQAVDAYLAGFNVEHLEDPRLAWTKVSPLVTSGNLPHEWVIKNVALQWYEQDGLGIVEEIQATENLGNIKSETISLLLVQAVNDNPESAFQQALKVPNDVRPGNPIVLDVLSVWARLDPQTAYNALEEIDDPFLLDLAPRIVVSTWAWKDPQYVLANIEEFPSNLQASATASALGNMATTAPLEAAELALEIENSNVRSNSISQVLNVWMHQDLEAAVSWVENAKTTGHQRYQLVSRLIDWLVSDDPQRAFEIARKETVLDWEEVGLEADVLRTIARWDSVETAVELLTQAREGKTRAVASANVVEVLIGNGDVDRALSLGLDLPEAEQAIYFPLITGSWVSVDPNNFVESIEQLPNAETRSKVVLKLYDIRHVDNYTTSYIENFTESQVEILKQHLTDEDRATIDNR